MQCRSCMTIDPDSCQAGIEPGEALALRAEASAPPRLVRALTVFTVGGVTEEFARVFGHFDRARPWIGPPSVGDIGSFRTAGRDSPGYFHNLSLVCVLIGAP